MYLNGAAQRRTVGFELFGCRGDVSPLLVHRRPKRYNQCWPLVRPRRVFHPHDGPFLILATNSCGYQSAKCEKKPKNDGFPEPEPSAHIRREAIGRFCHSSLLCVRLVVFPVPRCATCWALSSHAAPFGPHRRSHLPQNTSHDGYPGCRDVRQGHQGANPPERARRRRQFSGVSRFFPEKRVATRWNPSPPAPPRGRVGTFPTSFGTARRPECFDHVCRGRAGSFRARVKPSSRPRARFPRNKPCG